MKKYRKCGWSLIISRSILLFACLSMFFAAEAAADSVERDAFDFTFSADTAVKPFKVQNGTVSQKDGKLVYTFKESSFLESPLLTESRYAPFLESRNTLFFVMRNGSSASQIKLRFITEEDSVYDDAKSKTFDVDPNGPMRAHYFNLSNNGKAKGRVIGFRIEPLGGTGEIEIDRITFENEAKIEPFAGQIVSCTAKNDTVWVKGTIRSEYLTQYKTIEIYETAMNQASDDVVSMTKVSEIPVSQSFEINTIPLKNKDITRLSSQFLAVVKDGNGQIVKVAPRFYIENWRDFEDNQYAFKIPALQVDVATYGAKGDGFTDDTEAIQRAIDDVSGKGGGQVVLSGDDSFYGRRYVATNVKMKNNVDLHIQKGAVLWQSQNESDYKYKPVYLDVEMPGLVKTSCKPVANLPLIQGDSVKNIKITGEGKIRMTDVAGKGSDKEDYCTGLFHVVPIGLWKASNVEVSDVEIIRSNNNHSAFYGCEDVFIGNVKMYEAKGVGGDGIVLGFGTHRVKIVRMFLESDDDGVVLWTVYQDPREGLWWWSKPGEDHSVHNVEVYHSYINSGGGKAIAFVPWGSSDPNQEKEEIYNISVADNVLAGGFSVGTWPDNPYNGTPFDNLETNDYSPVKNVRIFNNLYLNTCDLTPVKATNVMTDCGINSSDVFLNGNFEHGYANWSLEKDAQVAEGTGYSGSGRLYQGLYLKKGNYKITADLLSSGNVFVENADTDVVVLNSKYRAGKGKTIIVPFSITEDGTYFIGITGKKAAVKQIRIAR